MENKYDNNLKCGLWKDKFTDKEGNEKKVLKGNITVDNKEYYVNVYFNDKKEGNQPDFSLYLKEKMAKKETLKEFEDITEEVESEDAPW